MVQSPSWEANRFAASQEIPRILWNQRFIAPLTSVRDLSLSWASPIQSTYPHPTSWRSILILSTHLHLGLLSGLFPSVFRTKTLYAPLSSPISATCPAYLILDFITRTTPKSVWALAVVKTMMLPHSVAFCVTCTFPWWRTGMTVVVIDGETS